MKDLILAGWNVIAWVVILIMALSYFPTHFVKHGQPSSDVVQMYGKCMVNVKSGNEKVCTDIVKAYEVKR